MSLGDHPRSTSMSIMVSISQLITFGIGAISLISPTLIFLLRMQRSLNYTDVKEIWIRLLGYRNKTKCKSLFKAKRSL